MEGSFQLSSLPEIRQLEQLLQTSHEMLNVSVLTQLESGPHRFPMYCVRIGNQSPSVPKVAMLGGFHGLERIGSQILIAYLETLVNRLEWDASLRAEFEKFELVMVPVVNPVGMHKNQRSNGNGIDLMRNAPITAEGRTSFLVGGHRLGSWLPWYRGKKGDNVEAENRAIITLVEQLITSSPFTLVLDCHSGFGMENRLWFPYACSLRPPENIADIFALYRLFGRSFPYQNYVMEPQSRHYLTHGDLWDYLYRRSLQLNCKFMPLTLELGSWRWVKKNPLQLGSAHGLFNPLAKHRQQRALRAHVVLLEFLLKASRNYSSWLPSGEERSSLQIEAEKHWYE